MRSLLAVVLIAGTYVLVSSTAFAQVSVSVFGLSKHSKSGFCEVNPGFGVSYGIQEKWRLTAVRYKNSLCVDSTAAGAVYTPWIYGRFSFGTALLRVTGYQDKAIYAPIPVVTYNGNGYAIDAIVVMKNSEGVIGVGIRIPLQSDFGRGT
jgi:hypothetical protein